MHWKPPISSSVSDRQSTACTPNGVGSFDVSTSQCVKPFMVIFGVVGMPGQFHAHAVNADSQMRRPEHFGERLV